jgi:hypothetical protein
MPRNKLTVQDVWDYLDEIGTPMSEEELDDYVSSHQAVPSFKIEYGKGIVEPMPSDMMWKKNKEAKRIRETTSDDLRTNVKSSKEKLPMFSFTMNDKVTAVVLDIENGITMKNFLKAIDKLAYFAYWSRRSETNKQRFRVIIPLLEPIDAKVYDYCKSRMMNVFDNIPDPHSFESKRFFFFPSDTVGDCHIDNVIRQQKGHSFDFMKTVNFTDADMKDMMEKERNKEESDEDDEFEGSAEENEKVQYYLETDFPYMTGNGDSASSFYTAICVCIRYNDEDTLEKVLDKARSENWSEKEIDYNVNRARNFVEGNM